MTSRLSIFTSLVLVATSIVASAQRGGLNIEDHLLIKEATYSRERHQGERYEGSPFLRDTFAVASVYSGSEKFNAVSMRYNIFEDVMEFENRGQIYLLDPDPRITRIEIGGEVFLAR